MPKTIVNAVDTWDLGEFLAMLGQVARDAGAWERAPESETEGQLPATPLLPIGASVMRDA